MAAPSRRKSAAKPPVSAVQHWRGQQSGDLAMRAVGLLLLLIVFLLLTFPSPIFGYPWRTVVFGPIAHVILAPVPTPEMGLPGFLPVAPVIQWIAWLWCVFLAYGAFTLLQHMLLLRMQTVAPLRHPRTYYRVRLPAGSAIDKEQGINLLRGLHGMLPAPRAVTGAGVPLVLRWTGVPDQPIRQGVSLLLPQTNVISVVKTLEGVAPGALVETADDPLTAVLQPGLHLAWCDLRLAAGDAVPLAIPPKDQAPLLEGLLPALAPPAGVRATDVQVLLRPIAQITAWRLKVLATAERLRVDVQSLEQKVINRKADGPGFDTTVRVLVLAETPDLAQGYLAVLVDAFAPTAQTIGTRQQRLRATKAQCIVVNDPPLPPPRAAKAAKPAKPAKAAKAAKPAKQP